MSPRLRDLGPCVGTAVALLTGCVSIPPYRGSGDGGADGADGATAGLAIRAISNAYREGGDDGTAVGTYMMSKEGYAITTSGILDGDLVLFIANVDNGAQTFWNLPAGFTQVVEREYGQDGQTYIVAWKIAAGEPQLYTGTYLPSASSSAAATISLVAVTGYDPQNPIEGFWPTDHQVPTDPADVGSPGITTMVDNSLLVFAAGADWTPDNGTNTFESPADFELLTSIGDRDTHWDWTCQVIATKLQPVAGFTGALTSTLTAKSYSDGTTPIPGGGWSVLLAIAPQPK